MVKGNKQSDQNFFMPLQHTRKSFIARLLNGDGDVLLHEGNKDSDFFRLVRGALIVMKNSHKISMIMEKLPPWKKIAAELC